MGVEELGLLLATVGALAVPPLRTIAVDNVAGSTVDGDLVTRDGNKRTRPLLVAEAGGTLESDGGSILELGKIKSGTGRDLNVVQDDVCARGLALDGRRSIREGAAGAGIQARRNSSHKSAGAEDKRGFNGNHFVYDG